MNALIFFFAISALTSSILGDEAVDAKHQEKRGVIGYGGSYVNGYNGYNRLGFLNGYNGLGHGYNPYFLGHSSGVATAVAPIAPIAPIAPVAAEAPIAAVASTYTPHAYTAPAYISPLALPHSYNYNHGLNAPLYPAPALRFDNAGAFRQNLGYYNSW